MKYRLCKDGQLRTIIRIPVSLTRDDYLHYSRLARALGYKSLQAAMADDIWTILVGLDTPKEEKLTAKWHDMKGAMTYV
jgi:hypothetical protein